MKEAFEIIKEYKEIGETEDLVFDDVKIEHFTPELKHEIEQLSELVYLSLNNCQLKSLNHFPQIKNLMTLELNDNQFPIRELLHLSGLTNLKSLDLDGLKIEKVEQLEPLKHLKSLERLEINECDFTEEKENVKKIFEYLPQLEILNGEDKEGNAVDYSEDECSDDDSEEDESNDESDSEEEEDDD